MNDKELVALIRLIFRLLDEGPFGGVYCDDYESNLLEKDKTQLWIALERLDK